MEMVSQNINLVIDIIIQMIDIYRSKFQWLNWWAVFHERGSNIIGSLPGLGHLYPVI